jgi:hypothetical protein
VFTSYGSDTMEATISPTGDVIEASASFLLAVGSRRESLPFPMSSLIGLASWKRISRLQAEGLISGEWNFNLSAWPRCCFLAGTFRCRKEAEAGFLFSGHVVASPDSASPVLDQATALATLTEGGVVLHATSLFLELIGQDRQELSGTEFSRFLEPSNASLSPIYQATLLQALAGERASLELPVLTKAGSRVCLMTRFSPASRGRVLLSAVDITSQKGIAEDMYCQLSAISKSHAVVTFDIAGTVLSANEIFLKVFFAQCYQY